MALDQQRITQKPVVLHATVPPPTFDICTSFLTAIEMCRQSEKNTVVSMCDMKI